MGQSKVGISMASITALSFFFTINVSATSSSSSLFTHSPKPRQPSKQSKPKRHRVSKVACNGNQNKPPTATTTHSEEANSSHVVGNRRDVLIGLGGLCGANALSINNPLPMAAPVAPDLENCGPPNLPNGAKPTNCCPPRYTKIIDFKFPSDQCRRLRPAAHLVDNEYISKYKKALQLMKALPADDPRSFTQQSKVHCAYCHNSYHQVGYPDLDIQIHNSWLFLPFHRWFLYFYERILGSLIKDPTFGIPFWNWDHPQGMEIPSIFTDRKSPLCHPLRNANHQPPTLVDLNWNKYGPSTSGDIKTNLSLMYTQLVSGAKLPSLFFGAPFRAGDKPYDEKKASGTLELAPHNTVHSWSGDNTQPNLEDMGAFYSAARDPLFYSHHANVDRLWTVWKNLGGKRKDLTDCDWLEASFLFYDENKNLVRVKITDSLDTKKLGYVFERVELPWRNAKPKPLRTKAQRLAQNPSTILSCVEFPFTLNSTVSSVVKRPKKSRSKKEKEEEEEVVVIEIEFDRREAVKFDVLINEEEDDEKVATPVNREFAGSFVNVIHAQNKESMVANTSFKVGITDLLEDLEAEDNDSVLVTLVPQYGIGRLVTVKDIRIEFVSD